MPPAQLKRLTFKPGINRENTSLFTEGGWYDCNLIRFRQGSPQKIGGWTKFSNSIFLGLCRSLSAWQTLTGYTMIGVGTNLKFYISLNASYYDITPLRIATTVANPFTATTGSSIISVTYPSHGCFTGDYLTFYGATTLGGAITTALLNREYAVTYVNDNIFTIDVGVNANSSDTGHGGSPLFLIQINIGSDIQNPLIGWGAGAWGAGTWGTGGVSPNKMRLWSQANFGQDLIFSAYGGGMYYWYTVKNVFAIGITFTVASPCVFAVAGLTNISTFSNTMAIQIESTGTLPTGLSVGMTYYVQNYNSVTGTGNLGLTYGGANINTSGTQSGTHNISVRAIPLAQLTGAADVPTIQSFCAVSDIYRFVFAFGCNDYGSTQQDPMLIRWSDQSNAALWTTTLTNQAGSLRLTRGSHIIACQQTRQELVVFTDSSVYVMQYLGYPLVWNAQLVGDNISIMGQNAVAYASGIIFWMGKDKFYMYDGRVQTLVCDVKEYVYDNVNLAQNKQIYGGTNEGFNEVWWFYCSGISTICDRYVIYNYVEHIWYYGTLGRTAWLDSGILNYPIAATYRSNVVNHEDGVDDYSGLTPEAIDAYVTSSEVDIDDGLNFAFIRRIQPDITFRGSGSNPDATVTPSVNMSITPLNFPGAGYTNPTSTGYTNNGAVAQTTTTPIEAFTTQIYVRVRGRQFVMKIESNAVGTMWQLGAPRIEVKLDGQKN